MCNIKTTICASPIAVKNVLTHLLNKPALNIIIPVNESVTFSSNCIIYYYYSWVLHHKNAIDHIIFDHLKPINKKNRTCTLSLFILRPKTHVDKEPIYRYNGYHSTK